MVRCKKLLITNLIIILLLFSVGYSLAETYTYTTEKDGKTYVTTKTITQDKMIIKTEIYDSNGALLDTQIVEKELEPTPEKELTYPQKSTQITTITPLPSANQSPSPTPQQDDKEASKSLPENFKTDLPLQFEDFGKIVVKTNDQQKELKTTPQEITENAIIMGLREIKAVELFAEQNNLKYKVNGIKQEKFLGIFEIKLSTQLIFDAETGNFEDEKQKILTRLLDLVSF